MQYTVNDFFCGAGGVALGFMNAGFKVNWACDFDKHCVKSYSHNVGQWVVEADVTKLTYSDVPKADGWAFGFPCQDLSVAGQQAGFAFRCKDCGAEPENYPTFLLAENVKGLKPYISALEKELESRGYDVYIQLYNSKYWDVPQNRERYYIVAIRKGFGSFEFPEEQHEYVPKLSSCLDNDVDEKYFIPDDKAQTIIAQALQRLEALGKVHPCITPDRVDKRQNGRRAKEDEAPMFTLTAQDLHGVIVEKPAEASEIEDAICKESGLLNPDGCGKTLRVGGGGVADKETQLSARFDTAVKDGISQKQRNGKGTFFGISPTLLSTDHKGPHLVIQKKENDK